MEPIIKKGICPYCESGSLSPITKDLSFSYRGHTIALKDQKVQVCSECGEETPSEEDYEEIKKVLSNFISDIDSLLSIRRKR